MCTPYFAERTGDNMDSMDKLKMEEKELKEKIEFCTLLIRCGSLVQATPEQSIRAFKLKENFEEELRVIKLKMGE